jgi:hypothetical protein
MADQITTDEDGKTYKNGVLQVKSGTPGVNGAIGDMVGALAKALGPRSITQRSTKINQAVDQATSSDLGNQFQ